MLQRLTIGSEEVKQVNQEEFLKLKVEDYNNSVGELKDYDCPLCKNKGYTMHIVENYDVLKPCQCKRVRESIKNIKNSGLEQLLNEYTFENYVVEEEWQQKVKRLAQHFVFNTYGNWFFMGGQVGSGKSHICTAIVKELLEQGDEALYMKWRDDSLILKQTIVGDSEEYNSKITKYKKVKVLYIDDFFKTEKGKLPTSADIMVAFEILNYRYMDQNLVTIISTEKSVDEILDIDEAIGSRLYQRSKKYCIKLPNDKSKNYRMKGVY